MDVMSELCWIQINGCYKLLFRKYTNVTEGSSSSRSNKTQLDAFCLQTLMAAMQFQSCWICFVMRVTSFLILVIQNFEGSLDYITALPSKHVAGTIN